MVMDKKMIEEVIGLEIPLDYGLKLQTESFNP